MSALQNGHVEVMKWLIEKGCGMSEKLCMIAAKEGNVEALKWLAERGCPITYCKIGKMPAQHGPNQSEVEGYNQILKWAKEKCLLCGDEEGNQIRKSGYP